MNLTLLRFLTWVLKGNAITRDVILHWLFEQIGYIGLEQSPLAGFRTSQVFRTDEHYFEDFVEHQLMLLSL